MQIVASSENGVIGIDNEIPWYLPEDLKFFKKKTTGNYVIMGRKTFESILTKIGKVLPNRENIVISSDADYRNKVNLGLGEKMISLTSLEAAINLINQWEKLFEGLINENEVFIIGGESIYNEAFEKGLVDNIYHTVIHKEFDGDKSFSVPQGYVRSTYQKKTYSEKADLNYSIFKWFKDPSEVQGWVDDENYRLFPDKNIIYK